MKRIIFSLLIIFLPVLFASGKNHTSTEGIFQYRGVRYSDCFEVEDSAIYIIGTDRSVVTAPFLDKEIVIPATVIHNGYEYKVEGVWDYAFDQCDDIERVVISDGVENIE